MKFSRSEFDWIYENHIKVLNKGYFCEFELNRDLAEEFEDVISYLEENLENARLIDEDSSLEETLDCDFNNEEDVLYYLEKTKNAYNIVTALLEVSEEEDED